MTVENQNSTDKEQEVQSKIESPETEVKTEQDESPSIKTDENHVNWRKFREEKEIQRKALVEAESRAKQKGEEAEALKNAMDAVLNNRQPQNQQSNDYYSSDEESEEQRIQKKVEEALERARRKDTDERVKREAGELPKKLKQAFRDFDQVCTPENLDYLEFKKKNLYETFRAAPDSFEKWAGIYEAVKDFVPYKEKNDDQRRIESNMKKPQANVPSITDSNPKGNSWNLTEQRKKENWVRMQRDQKNIAS